MCREDVRIMADTSTQGEVRLFTTVGNWRRILPRSANRASLYIEATDSGDAMLAVTNKQPTVNPPAVGTPFNKTIQLSLLYHGDIARAEVWAFSLGGSMILNIQETLFNDDVPVGA